MLSRSKVSQRERRRGIDGWIAGAGALALGIAAAIWFGSRPGNPVMIGMDRIDHLVPAHYQVCVFPAFGAMVALLAADILRDEHRASRTARGVLLASTSALACVRLAGALPLSGHVLFLAALLVHELASRGRSGHVLLWLLALPAFGLTAWYKLFVWQDYTWFVASFGVGAGIGVACRWLWRRR
jgi:hypothetical protein